MTKLEELRSAWDAAYAAIDAAIDAADKARKAYKAELKKQGEIE